MRLRGLRFRRRRSHPVPRDGAKQATWLPQPSRLRSALLCNATPSHHDMTTSLEIRLPALRIEQGGGQAVFSFAVDGKRLRDFAAVSRVKRVEDATIAGYQ